MTISLEKPKLIQSNKNNDLTHQDIKSKPQILRWNKDTRWDVKLRKMAPKPARRHPGWVCLSAQPPPIRCLSPTVWAERAAGTQATLVSGPAGCKHPIPYRLCSIHEYRASLHKDGPPPRLLLSGHRRPRDNILPVYPAKHLKQIGPEVKHTGNCL